MAKVTNMGYEDENVVDDTPLTQEERMTALAFNENDILKNLAGNAAADHTETIEVKFGSTVFQFRIRPLTEKEYEKCRDRNTRYSKNRKLGGMRLPESTNSTGYHSDLIYTATVEEDRKKLWDNQTFWKAVNVITGVDMVDKLIPYAGKKQAIVERIEILSGFDDESETEYGETVKN